MPPLPPWQAVRAHLQTFSGPSQKVLRCSKMFCFSRSNRKFQPKKKVSTTFSSCFTLWTYKVHNTSALLNGRSQDVLNVRLISAYLKRKKVYSLRLSLWILKYWANPKLPRHCSAVPVFLSLSLSLSLSKLAWKSGRSGSRRTVYLRQLLLPPAKEEGRIIFRLFIILQASVLGFCFKLLLQAFVSSFCFKNHRNNTRCDLQFN